MEDNADLRDYLVRLPAGQRWSVDAVGDADAALRQVELSRVCEVLVAAGEHQVSTLRKALGTRDTISRAVDITMALDRCDAAAAFDRLAAASKNRDMKVRDLAAEVVERFTPGLP